ncbi:hypothetical protein KIPB_008958, partial [Kipferlia bialata]|eukprot:g8958.t1
MPANTLRRANTRNF